MQDPERLPERDAHGQREQRDGGHGRPSDDRDAQGREEEALAAPQRAQHLLLARPLNPAGRRTSAVVVVTTSARNTSPAPWG